jgi:hypothetical protein
LITLGAGLWWKDYSLMSFGIIQLAIHPLSVVRVFAPAPFIIWPAFFASISLWFYAGSGFLLKASRRFDIGFQWFNRHLRRSWALLLFVVVLCELLMRNVRGKGRRGPRGSRIVLDP